MRFDMLGSIGHLLYTVYLFSVVAAAAVGHTDADTTMTRKGYEDGCCDEEGGVGD